MSYYKVRTWRKDKCAVWLVSADTMLEAIRRVLEKVHPETEKITVARVAKDSWQEVTNGYNKQ